MKNILPIIGILLLISFISGGNYQHLTNWSTAEMVGYNFWGLIELIGGTYLIYSGIKKIKDKKDIKS